MVNLIEPEKLEREKCSDANCCNNNSSESSNEYDKFVELMMFYDELYPFPVAPHLDFKVIKNAVMPYFSSIKKMWRRYVLR